GTQMKSTGEVMALERSLEAALSKAMRSLEQRPPDAATIGDAVLVDVPNDRRLFALREALRRGEDAAELARRSGWLPWVVGRLGVRVAAEGGVRGGLDPAALAEAKRRGVADARVAEVSGVPVDEVRRRRAELGLRPVYKCVDTCAAEFLAAT